MIVALERDSLAHAAAAPLPATLLVYSRRAVSGDGNVHRRGLQLAAPVRDTALGEALWRQTTEVCSLSRLPATDQGAFADVKLAEGAATAPSKKKRKKGVESTPGCMHKGKKAMPKARGGLARAQVANAHAGKVAELAQRYPAAKPQPKSSAGRRQTDVAPAVERPARGMAAANTKIGPMNAPPGTVVTDGSVPLWSAHDALEWDHDKAFRSLAAFPSRVLENSLIVILRVDYWGCLKVEHWR